MSGLVPTERIEKHIYLLRGHKVMLSTDLAELYGVAPKALVQAVKRNIERFPGDFMFQLSLQEGRNLKSQTVTSSGGHGGRRKSPWAFTEHGAIMAASVLSSPRAVEMSVFVVRALVRLRDLARTHADFGAKLDALERKVAGHDADLKQMFAALRALLQPATRPRRRIWFGEKAAVIWGGSGSR